MIYPHYDVRLMNCTIYTLPEPNLQPEALNIRRKAVGLNRRLEA